MITNQSLAAKFMVVDAVAVHSMVVVRFVLICALAFAVARCLGCG